MPAFNAAKFIGQSIRSVISQSFQSWELIIVNDGSKDITSDVVSVFANYESKIKYLEQKNKGVARARNLGLRNASGKYIVFLDSDDVWDDNFLKKTYDCLQKYPLVFSKYRIIDRSGSLRPRFGRRSGSVTTRQIVTNNPIGTLTVGVRRDILADDYFDTRFYGTEDWDLWIRLSKKHSWYFADFCAANYRVHAAGISKNALRMYNQELSVLREHNVNRKSAYLLLRLRLLKRLIS